MQSQRWLRYVWCPFWLQFKLTATRYQTHFSQAASLHSDGDLEAHIASHLARMKAARAAVAAIPVSPATSGFIGLTALHPGSPSGAKEALFGRVYLAPVIASHFHTPHCGPACSLRFAPHTHSAACNHARAPVGAVWLAASRGDVAALEAALTAGGSTEELNEVWLDYAGGGWVQATFDFRACAAGAHAHGTLHAPPTPIPFCSTLRRLFTLQQLAKTLCWYSC